MSVGTTAYRESRTDLVTAIILLFSVCAFGVLLWNRQAALLSLVYPGAAFKPSCTNKLPTKKRLYARRT